MLSSSPFLQHGFSTAPTSYEGNWQWQLVHLSVFSSLEFHLVLQSNPSLANHWLLHQATQSKNSAYFLLHNDTTKHVTTHPITYNIQISFVRSTPCTIHTQRTLSQDSCMSKPWKPLLATDKHTICDHHKLCFYCFFMTPILDPSIEERVTIEKNLNISLLGSVNLTCLPLSNGVSSLQYLLISVSGFLQQRGWGRKQPGWNIVVFHWVGSVSFFF